MKKNLLFLCTLAAGLLLSACKKKETKPEEPDYTNFKILSVKVTAMPFLDGSNTTWDPSGGAPDVFFKMETANNTILYDGSSSRVNDVSSSDLPLGWSFVNAYQITNLTVTHYVTLYDYDTLDPNDLIGYVGFSMQDHKDGYPKTIVKSSGSITVSITGEWY